MRAEKVGENCVLTDCPGIEDPTGRVTIPPPARKVVNFGVHSLVQFSVSLMVVKLPCPLLPLLLS